MIISSKEHVGKMVTTKIITYTEKPEWTRPVLTKPLYRTLNTITGRVGSVITIRKRTLDHA